MLTEVSSRDSTSLFLRVDLRMSIGQVNVRSQRRDLALPNIRSITRQLVTVLDLFELVGVVCGDVKPENVMIVNHHKQPIQVKLVEYSVLVLVVQLRLF